MTAVTAMTAEPAGRGCVPRRSALYVPAGNARALAKARELPADVLIFDWEDAVAADGKAAARARVVSALADWPRDSRERLVRINAPDSALGRDDLAAAADLPLDGLVVPKVESPAALDIAAAAGLPLWIMLETPRGVLDADALAAHPAAAALVLGLADIGACLQLPYNAADADAGLQYARSRCVYAAAAHGLDAIDGIHAEWQAIDELSCICARARALGFAGKSLVHPSQIPIANRCFAPSESELRWARRVAHAWQTGRRAGEAVTSLDGRLVEELHVHAAQRLLNYAEQLNRAS